MGSAGASGPFLEQAFVRGLIYTTANEGTFGKGLGFVNLDDDGDPDVVALGRSDGRVGIFENDGSGNFTDRPTTSGIPLLTDPSGLSAADYDASTCGGDHAVMVWGQIGDWSEYQGDVGATCDLGSSGSGSFDFAGDNVWFNLIWVDEGNVAGHPGFGSSSPRSWPALGLCNVVTDNHSDVTCD